MARLGAQQRERAGHVPLPMPRVCAAVVLLPAQPRFPPIPAVAAAAGRAWPHHGWPGSRCGRPPGFSMCPKNSRSLAGAGGTGLACPMAARSAPSGRARQGDMAQWSRQMWCGAAAFAAREHDSGAAARPAAGPTCTWRPGGAAAGQSARSCRHPSAQRVDQQGPECVCVRVPADTGQAA